MIIPANDKNNHRILKILVDDRERNDKLLTTLRKANGVEVHIGRLPVGDYLLEHLLIERKSFSDLCISIMDGRLFRQAAQLASSHVQPVIILEGTSADLKTTGINREAIQGALITLTLIFRIPLLRSQSPEESAKLIIYAAKQIENLSTPFKAYPPPRHGRNNLYRKQKMQIHILQGFPGIGLIRSKQLVDKFGTLTAIFNASPQELAEVPGMGKISIKYLIDLLN